MLTRLAVGVVVVVGNVEGALGLERQLEGVWHAGWVRASRAAKREIEVRINI